MPPGTNLLTPPSPTGLGAADKARQGHALLGGRGRAEPRAAAGKHPGLAAALRPAPAQRHGAQLGAEPDLQSRRAAAAAPARESRLRTAHLVSLR